MAYATSTSWPVAVERDTVNAAGPPSSATVVSPTEIVGATSSSSIVPMPWASPIGAPAGFDRFTVKVSSPSTTMSPRTWTGTMAQRQPPVSATVPLFAT